MSLLVDARSLVGEWLSLVEHLVRDQGVGGSNPLSPTILFCNLHPRQLPPSRSLCRNRLVCLQNRGDGSLNPSQGPPQVHTNVGVVLRHLPGYVARRSP